MPSTVPTVKTGATVSPAESEVASIAYQLWLDGECPAGSRLEDWFRTEEMFKNALVVKREDQFRRPSSSSCDPSAGSEILAGFPWEGHWEIWEREWVSARWVWDVRASRVGVSSQTCPSRKVA